MRVAWTLKTVFGNGIGHAILSVAEVDSTHFFHCTSNDPMASGN